MVDELLGGALLDDDTAVHEEDSGRSGAGKSTLASLIRGELAPASGSVTLNGVPTSSFGDGAARDAVLTTLKNNGKSLEYVVSEYPLEWKE